MFLLTLPRKPRPVPVRSWLARFRPGHDGAMDRQAALLWLAVGLSACAVLAGSSLAPALVAISRAMGADDALWPRLLVSLPALGVPFGAVLYTRLASPAMDRVILLAALSAYAVSGVLGAFVPQPGVMLTARFAQGLTIAPLMLIALRILAAGQEPQRNMALQSTMMTAVTVVVLLASGAMAAIDWHLPFLLNLLPLALIPAVRVLVAGGQPAAVMRPAPASQQAATQAGAGAFLVGLLLAFLAMATFFAIPTQMPGALVRGGYEGSGLAALVIVAGVLAASAGGLVLRRMQAALAPSLMLRFAWGCGAVGFLQLSYGANMPLIFSGAALVGFGFGITFPVLNHWAATGAFGMSRPKAMGMITAAFHLGQFAAPLLGAAALRGGDGQGIFMPYLALAAFAFGFVWYEAARVDQAANPQRPGQDRAISDHRAAQDLRHQSRPAA
ncbi:MFS transporter [Paracoccus sp. (in: a-proteobacteria)]|uniref:MFS transporter n=1 Tax=Paracoccus sp. TaxID=267 RepID=UPI003A8A3FCA